ncbi:MAG: LD-carboxypeptidase [Candidatus Binatia bacterium]
MAVVAPAGVCDPLRLASGVRLLGEWGLEVEDLTGTSPVRYMAGTDGERTSLLEQAFSRPDLRAVLAARGGFGSTRLQGRFDMARVADNPRMFVGFSDLSILLNRFVKEANLVCYHGPMIAADLLRISRRGRESFRRFLFGESGWWDGRARECWRPGSAEGQLRGGCLSVLVTTLGTAAEIETDGCILFLEDVAEKPYRIDRMMTHLRQAGKFRRVAGVVLGPMTDCDDHQGPSLLRDIVMEALDGTDCPVVWGLQAGHGCDNVVLPFGCRVRLDASAPGLELLEEALA